MRKSFANILIPALCSALSAAAFSSIDHTPRDGDHLHPGICESRQLILSVNDSTKKVLIYPDAVSFDVSLDASAYIDNDTIAFVQFANKHRFLLRNDTLSYVGYENRSTDFRLDYPVRVMVFPLKGGDVAPDLWTGHVKHNGSMLLKHVKGESLTRVSDGWTLTDGTDSLCNITRMTWTLDMSYVNPDSIGNLSPDSITSEMVSDMNLDVEALKSERLLTERTLWFSPDARYPVLTDSRVSRIRLSDDGSMLDTIPSSALAMYYPPGFQYSDTGEDPVGRKKENMRSDNGYGDGDDPGASMPESRRYQTIHFKSRCRPLQVP